MRLGLLDKLIITGGGKPPPSDYRRDTWQTSIMFIEFVGSVVALEKNRAQLPAINVAVSDAGFLVRLVNESHSQT